MFSVPNRIFFIGARQFIVSLVILLGALFFASVGFGILRYFNPLMAYSLALSGPDSALSWIVLLVIVGWYPIALAVWVAKDAAKFQAQGINIRPVLWAIGTALPTIFVVFPAYYVLRDVVWRRKIQTSSAKRDFILNAVAVIFVVYAVVMITGLPQKLNKPRTDAQVAKIHATKLTLDDVLGKNLPPDPGADSDKTVQGIDANNNGIRDDVELAIFKEYPNSAKTRAVLLQYALALQMEAVQPFVNTDTVTEVVREQSRAYACVGKILSRSDLQDYIEKGDQLRLFIKTQQFNTDERKAARNKFVEKVGSYSESTNEVCDIDLSILSN